VFCPTFFFAKQIPIPELDGEIPNLTNGWLPTVLIVIGAYYIATSFFSVYSMAVDTLFLCLLEDLERNDGTLEKPYFGPKGLLKIVGKKQQFANEHANEHEMKRLVKEG
jgi:choline transporter-like protein 2/4/5